MENLELQKKVSDLRSKGYSFRKIGEELGIPKTTVENILKKLPTQAQDEQVQTGFSEEFWFNYMATKTELSGLSEWFVQHMQRMQKQTKTVADNVVWLEDNIGGIKGNEKLFVDKLGTILKQIGALQVHYSKELFSGVDVLFQTVNKGILEKVEKEADFLDFIGENEDLEDLNKYLCVITDENQPKEHKPKHKSYAKDPFTLEMCNGFTEALEELENIER